MKEKYMKDFNGEKIFCLEYDKETLRDMVIYRQEEIEKLENIIKELKIKFYETFRINQNGSYTITETDYKDIEEILDKVEVNK